MGIPNAEQAIVNRKKIVDYLLNARHPDNGGKARFFESLGFSAEKWTLLAEAFRDHAVTETSVESRETNHGVK